MSIALKQKCHAWSAADEHGTQHCLRGCGQKRSVLSSGKPKNRHTRIVQCTVTLHVVRDKEAGEASRLRELKRSREHYRNMNPTAKKRLLAERREQRKNLDVENRKRVSETQRRSYNRRKAKGICASCTKPRETSLFCLEHWFYSVGKAYGFSLKNGGTAELRRKWTAQGGRCAISGEHLTPGENASLDHIVPRARGGASSIENVQWVTKKINAAKYDRTVSEFVDLCRSVVSYADKVTE